MCLVIICQLIPQAARVCALFISKPEEPRSTIGLVVCRKEQLQGFSGLEVATFFPCHRSVFRNYL